MKEKTKFRVLPWLCCVPFAALFFLFTFVMAGYSFSALVCLCIIAVIAFYELTRMFREKNEKVIGLVRRIFTVCLVIGLIIAGITEGIIIKASFGSPDAQVDYMVVLGAKVRPDGPSVSLQNRIDAAYEYLLAHPDTVAVVSGGQGPDEHMTEALCMFQELTAMGIAPERIWLEERATSTWENLTFSLAIIEERTGSRPETLGVLSSEYHLFRASLLTKECGVDFVGIPAHTTRISQMINHFMREIAGVWHYILLGGQYD